MINFILFDNLLDFINELIELLKEDWKKFKLFVKENKKNLIWLFIALITLQFTDLINIGNSCNKYYKRKNEEIQNGGSGSPPGPGPVVTTPEAQTAPAGPSKGQRRRARRAAAKAAGAAGAGPGAAGAGPGASGAGPGAAGADTKGKDKKPAKSGDNESKNVQKNIDLFKKLKGEKDKLAKNGMAGPVFSNLDGIFGAVGGIFTLVITILTILGILSLPVLIFIIITYCIVKKLLNHLALI
jgi:hypothetical protein